MTTITTTNKAHVRRMTRAELRAEINRLLRASGMTRSVLQARGVSYQLDAEHRGLLAEIEGLEWLLSDKS
jgi:hypothetical protein